MTNVTITGLHKSFGDRVVLAGVDLDVPAGSLTAVLGPSGSGKTTLLRVLAGFEQADSGVVRLGGTVVDGDGPHVPPEVRRTGYVPQEGALFPHLDAAANVAFGLPRRERKGQRARELLDLVGLDGMGHLYPHQLSGGQQQRVALARALAVRPSLVLLDEPFSSLDAALRSEVRADVARVLSSTGTTAVLVTHDQDEALSLADRVAVLRNGRVAQCAGPEELYTDPVDPGLAGFVGDANVVEGTMHAGRARTSLGELAVCGDAGGLPDGQRVLVLVRPEQVSLAGLPEQGTRTVAHPAPQPVPGLNSEVWGWARECSFYGHDMLVRVEMAGGPMPARPTGRAGAATAATRPVVQVRLTGRTPLKAGNTVTLSVTGPVKAWPA